LQWSSAVKGGEGVLLHPALEPGPPTVQVTAPAASPGSLAPRGVGR
jgi:hypothetical protein